MHMHMHMHMHSHSHSHFFYNNAIYIIYKIDINILIINTIQHHKTTQYNAIQHNKMSSQSSQPSQSSQDQHSFSLIEIDGNLYYLKSLHIDECIINYSHTMTTSFLETLTKYAGALSDEKVTAVVFKNIDTTTTTTTTTQEKKVVGFWNPQLSKFILDTL